jgi:hypothetical protein
MNTIVTVASVWVPQLARASHAAGVADEEAFIVVPVVRSPGSDPLANLAWCCVVDVVLGDTLDRARNRSDLFRHWGVQCRINGHRGFQCGFVQAFDITLITLGTAN